MRIKVSAVYRCQNDVQINEKKLEDPIDGEDDGLPKLALTYELADTDDSNGLFAVDDKTELEEQKPKGVTVPAPPPRSRNDQSPPERPPSRYRYEYWTTELWGDELRDVIAVDYEPGSEEENHSQMWDSSECMFRMHPHLNMDMINKMDSRFINDMMIDCGYDFTK